MQIILVPILIRFWHGIRCLILAIQQEAQKSANSSKELNKNKLENKEQNLVQGGQ